MSGLVSRMCTHLIIQSYTVLQEEGLSQGDEMMYGM